MFAKKRRNPPTYRMKLMGQRSMEVHHLLQALRKGHQDAKALLDVLFLKDGIIIQRRRQSDRCLIEVWIPKNRKVSIALSYFSDNLYRYDPTTRMAWCVKCRDDTIRQNVQFPMDDKL